MESKEKYLLLYFLEDFGRISGTGYFPGTKKEIKAFLKDQEGAKNFKYIGAVKLEKFIEGET